MSHLIFYYSEMDCRGYCSWLHNHTFYKAKSKFHTERLADRRHLSLFTFKQICHKKRSSESQLPLTYLYSATMNTHFLVNPNLSLFILSWWCGIRRGISWRAKCLFTFKISNKLERIDSISWYFLQFGRIFIHQLNYYQLKAPENF